MRLIDYLANWRNGGKGIKVISGEGKFSNLWSSRIKRNHPLVFLRRTQGYRVAKSLAHADCIRLYNSVPAGRRRKVLHKLASSVGPKLMENIYDITVSEKLNP